MGTHKTTASSRKEPTNAAELARKRTAQAAKNALSTNPPRQLRRDAPDPSLRPPDGWPFVAVGHRDLVDKCKDISRERGVKFAKANAPVYYDDDHRESRQFFHAGYHCKTDIFDEACTALGYEVVKGKLTKIGQADQVDPAAAFAATFARFGSDRHKPKPRKREDDEIDEVRRREAKEERRKAFEIIKESFPLMPDETVNHIIQTSWQPGAKTVGNAHDINIIRRCNMATVAHIRHKYTKYDYYLASGTGRSIARELIRADTEKQLQLWRGPDDSDFGGLNGDLLDASSLSGFDYDHSVGHESDESSHSYYSDASHSDDGEYSDYYVGAGRDDRNNAGHDGSHDTGSHGHDDAGRNGHPDPVHHDYNSPARVAYNRVAPPDDYTPYATGTASRTNADDEDSGNEYHAPERIIGPAEASHPAYSSEYKLHPSTSTQRVYEQDHAPPTPFPPISRNPARRIQESTPSAPTPLGAVPFQWPDRMKVPESFVVDGVTYSRVDAPSAVPPVRKTTQQTDFATERMVSDVPAPPSFPINVTPPHLHVLSNGIMSRLFDFSGHQIVWESSLHECIPASLQRFATEPRASVSSLERLIPQQRYDQRPHGHEDDEDEEYDPAKSTSLRDGVLPANHPSSAQGQAAATARQPDVSTYWLEAPHINPGMPVAIDQYGGTAGVQYDRPSTGRGYAAEHPYRERQY